MSRAYVILGVLAVFAPFGCSAESDRENCDKGDMKACAGLAASYEYGARGLPQDDHKAFALYQKACNGHLLSSCATLGSFYANGRGVPVSYAMARTMFERSCTQDESSGCNGLGVLYRDGHGVPVDLQRAHALFTRACADSTRPQKGAGPREYGPACPNKRDVEARIAHAK